MQYHFWVGEDGLDAWGVARLIRLSAEFPVREVEVEALHDLDTVYWFDGTMERATVRTVVERFSLIQEVDPSCPIILGVDGWVMDGMHRVERPVLECRVAERSQPYSSRS